MKKYNFPQFKVEIVDPQAQDIHVIDNIYAKSCNVSVVLVDPSGSKFGVNFTGFTYDKTWTDSAIETFIQNELEKYLVNG